MCHESFNQMEAIFKGKQRTLESTALELLARTQDKNFESVDRKFESMDEKLDKIIEMIQANEIKTDAKIDGLDRKYAQNCSEHKRSIATEIEKLQVTTEELNFFKRNPKALNFVAILILIIIGFLVGKTDLIEKIL